MHEVHEALEQELLILTNRRERLAERMHSERKIAEKWPRLERVWSSLERPLSVIRQGGPPDEVQPAVLDAQRHVAILQEAYRRLEQG